MNLTGKHTLQYTGGFYEISHSIEYDTIVRIVYRADYFRLDCPKKPANLYCYREKEYHGENAGRDRVGDRHLHA